MAIRRYAWPVKCNMLRSSGFVDNALFSHNSANVVCTASVTAEGRQSAGGTAPVTFPASDCHRSWPRYQFVNGGTCVCDCVKDLPRVVA